MLQKKVEWEVLMQQTPHQKWWKVWLIVVDMVVVIHLKVSMEFSFFIWLHWVSAILSTKVRGFFHLSFYFPLVNFVSGTLLLLKPHPHKVRRGIFQSTTKLYYKQNNGGFFFFGGGGSKEF
jgi:hypothetical protein